MFNKDRMKKIKVIVISGTPATGKTRLAREISKHSNFKLIEITKLIKKDKLHEYYDKKRKTYVVDIKKLNKILINIIKNSKKNLIFDSHLSHFLPKKYVNLCIITKCRLKILKNRLKKRNYSKVKTRENLESEIFNVCLNEAKTLRHNILVIETSKDIKNIKPILKLVK